MKLYLAYGANTNLSSMHARCPAAKYLCNLPVHHHQLVFRGVADTVQRRGYKVECALWVLTPECEAALDRFEGFPTLYVKKYLRVGLRGQQHRVMMYVMRDGGRALESPSAGYEACLREGYAQCGIPVAQLDAALRRSITPERAVITYTPERASAFIDALGIDDETGAIH